MAGVRDHCVTYSELNPHREAPAAAVSVATRPREGATSLDFPLHTSGLASRESERVNGNGGGEDGRPGGQRS